MHGAIAAGHPLTAEAGARVLRQGGNAVDALLAAAFTAFVTEGPLTGPAGGGFLLVHEPGGTTSVLDCFFAVPSRKLGEMEEVLIDFGDSGTQVFHIGLGSVAVPGLLAGLEEAHRRFATREWAELASPAVELARVGFVRDEPRAFLHGILDGVLLREEVGRRVYGDPARVVTADLVPTLERVRDVGAASVFELLPEFEEDLRAYRVAGPEPLEIQASGHRILSTPKPSLGGAVVERFLELLDAATAPTLVDEAQAIALPARTITRRPAHYGLDIQFEDRPEEIGLGRLTESTVWVNRAHPAYRRAQASHSIGYHIALAVAMALAPLAVDAATQHEFVTAFLTRWGEALDKPSARKRR